MNGNGFSLPRVRRFSTGWIACEPKPVPVSRIKSLHFTRGWPSMDVTGNHALDVAKRFCVFATLITRLTIAPDVRRVEQSSPIAVYRGCSDQNGPALWRNWRHSNGNKTLADVFTPKIPILTRSGRYNLLIPVFCTD